ncbi:hypothetical protein Dimus_016179, partial [Dionaea muscipula]
MRLVFDEAEDPGLRMKIEEENSEPRSENLDREVRIWRKKRKTRTLVVVVVVGGLVEMEEQLRRRWWRWRNNFVWFCCSKNSRSASASRVSFGLCFVVGVLRRRRWSGGDGWRWRWRWVRIDREREKIKLIPSRSEMEMEMESVKFDGKVRMEIGFHLDDGEVRMFWRSNNAF